MAKQTFTVGQVLTAAQLTSLQQTAMLGGSASAKTASYTLVAADAGTAISMTSTSATTITVNTGLFAAGDTVQITNLGSGVSTITAGTATVNTSASLALAQYESGTLYFTSTSAAIFIKGAGTAVTPGANFTLLNSGGTALTGATTITVSGISGKDKLAILIDNSSSVNTNFTVVVRFNSDSGANYARFGLYLQSTTSQQNETSSFSDNQIYMASSGTSSPGSVVAGYIMMDGCNSAGVKRWWSIAGGNGTAAVTYPSGGVYKGTSTISSVDIVSSNGNFDGGTVYIYGSA